MRWSCPRAIQSLPLILMPFYGGVLPAQKSGPSWKFTPTLSVFAEVDDNPFLLDPSQKTLLAAPPAGTPADRYANMERTSDLLAKVRLELEFRGPALGGRSMTITPDFRYDYYASNGERNAAKAGISVAQSLGHGSRLRLKAEMTGSAFLKNYLSDAVDANADGSIALGERIYRPGSSAERTVQADYVFRLKKSGKARPTGAFVRVSAGHAVESYDAPFLMRDRAGPLASLELALDRGRRELDVAYSFASMAATATRAVLLLNEPDFGVDFNGNGSNSDLEARAFEMVDYSRTEHGLSLAGRVPAGQRTTLRAEFEHRRRNFGSSQPYDVSHRGRRDVRNTFQAGVSFKPAKSVRLLAELEMRKQTANKPLDAAGDVTDYTRRRLTTGLTYAY